MIKAEELSDETFKAMREGTIVKGIVNLKANLVTFFDNDRVDTIVEYVEEFRRRTNDSIISTIKKDPKVELADIPAMGFQYFPVYSISVIEGCVHICIACVNDEAVFMKILSEKND